MEVNTDNSQEIKITAKSRIDPSTVLVAIMAGGDKQNHVATQPPISLLYFTGHKRSINEKKTIQPNKEKMLMWNTSNEINSGTIRFRRANRPSHQSSHQATPVSKQERSYKSDLFKFHEQRH